MSILSDKTENRAIRIVTRSLKILEEMPANVRMAKTDDFELSLAISMLKSIKNNNNEIIKI
jgi:hypothetical protein